MGVGDSAPRPGRLYPRQKLDTHCTGDWVGPRAGLDGRKTLVPTEIFSFFLIFAFILQMFVSYYNRSDIDKPEIRKM